MQLPSARACGEGALCDLREDVQEHRDEPREQAAHPRQEPLVRGVAREEREGVEGGAQEDGEAEHDPLYEDAVRLVVEFGKASTSLLQRRLRIGGSAYFASRGRCSARCAVSPNREQTIVVRPECYLGRCDAKF